MYLVRKLKQSHKLQDQISPVTWLTRCLSLSFNSSLRQVQEPSGKNIVALITTSTHFPVSFGHATAASLPVPLPPRLLRLLLLLLLLLAAVAPAPATAARFLLLLILPCLPTCFLLAAHCFCWFHTSRL